MGIICWRLCLVAEAGFSMQAHIVYACWLGRHIEPRMLEAPFFGDNNRLQTNKFTTSRNQKTQPQNLGVSDDRCSKALACALSLFADSIVNTLYSHLDLLETHQWMWTVSQQSTGAPFPNSTKSIPSINTTWANCWSTIQPTSKKAKKSCPTTPPHYQYHRQPQTNQSTQHHHEWQSISSTNHWFVDAPNLSPVSQLSQPVRFTAVHLSLRRPWRKHLNSSG